MTQLDAEISPDAHAVRYVCGSTMYDEALVDGHWLGRYWSTSPSIRPEGYVVQDLVRTWPYVKDAFDIEIDGQSLSGHWQWDGADVRETEHGSLVEVRLTHAVRPVALRVFTALDGTPFLTRWLEITNMSQGTMALASVAPFSGTLWRVTRANEILVRERSAFALGSFGSDTWGREGAFEWRDIVPGRDVELDGHRGRSGYGRPTAFVQNRLTGEMAIVDLGWSGNWRINVRQDRVVLKNELPDGEAMLSVEARPVAPSPQRVISAGEAIRTPSVHVTIVRGNLDDASQALHEHIRRSVLRGQPRDRVPRIDANHWGYAEDRVDPAFLKSDIDVAASVGCELYVLDAGWFGQNRGDWYAAVGDWTAGDWLPGGVEEIREYARDKGLQFGLWMEIESVGSRSKVLAEHPDWVLKCDGRPVGKVTPDGGHFALDLSNPQVAVWVEDRMRAVVERYDLNLLKIDYNLEVWHGGENVKDGYIENTIWRHYEVLYSILGRLRAQFPELIIQNCAGGGGRTDLGIVGQSDITVLSDWNMLPRGLLILNGMTLVLPPEICDRAVGWGTREDLDRGLASQLRIAILGHPTFMGISPSLVDFIPSQREQVEHAITLYKDFIRPFLTTCRVYHHTPDIQFDRPEGFCVLEYVSQDRHRAVAAVFKLSGREESYRFQSRGLDLGATYRVTFDNSREAVEVSGFELRQSGIRVDIESELSSELLLFEMV